MGRIFSEICSFLIVIFLSGCILDKDDSKETEDEGSYIIETNKTEIQSYPDGGGLFIIMMTPSEDFMGKVRLSVSANNLLNSRLTNEALSLEKRITEVEIHPDKITEIDEYILKIISQHGVTVDTLFLKIDVVEPNLPWNSPIYYGNAVNIHNMFIQWLQDTNPKLGVNDTNDWFFYNNSPIIIPGAPGDWTFLSETWDITVIWAGYPFNTESVLLRKRGESKPMFAALKDKDGKIREIPVSDFRTSLYSNLN